jgi:uncharacterized protein GlcG (DUF336 family)
MKQLRALLAGIAVIVLFTPIAWGAGVALSGDDGRPNDGVPPINATPRPANPNPPKLPRAPSIELAMAAARAIAAGCKQYRLGVAIVNAAGAPILVYIPDGSQTRHAFFATRKAYSAVVFKAKTSEVTDRAQQQDPEITAMLKADPNLVAYPGGLPLRVGNEIVGAIGVSGADPNPHNEECGQIGVDKIRAKLK